MNTLLEAIHELNLLEAVSESQISTYVDTIDHFIDCLGRSKAKGTVLLYTNPKQGTAADFDVLGNHVCFSSDLFAEPTIMNKFNFGFILNKKSFEDQLAYYKQYNNPDLPEEEQIYGKLVSYHDLQLRMSKDKGKASPVFIKALREKTDGTCELLLHDWFHWRKITKELYDKLEESVISQDTEYDSKHYLYEFPEDASEDDLKLNKNIKKLYLYGNFPNTSIKINAELGYFPSIQNNYFQMHGPRLVNYELKDGKLKHVPLVFDIDSKEYKDLLNSFDENEYRVYIPKNAKGEEKEYITIFSSTLDKIVLPQTYNDVNVYKAFWEHRRAKGEIDLLKNHKGEGHDTVYKKLQELFDLLKTNYKFTYWNNPKENIKWLWDSQKYSGRDEEREKEILNYKNGVID